MAATTLADVIGWDKRDKLRACRDAFALPEGVIYLDGNSLGPLPRAAEAHLADVVRREWGTGLIGSWDAAGWMAAPARIGGKIARLVGAAPDEVIVADSTSVNLFKILAAAVALRPGRSRIVLEADNFPTDRHVAEGLQRLLPALEIVAVPADSLAEAVDSRTAALLACHVHYRSGARLDMAVLSAAAHAAGALSLWDISHSAGAVEVALRAAGADMAVGCGYKFLNGGPGAPAFLYVARALQADARPPLQGWMGHEAPFGFSDRFAPAPGVSRFLTGTPAVLGLAALEAAVDLANTVDQPALWEKSARMFTLFAERAGTCAGLELLTPREPALRGSQISFRHGAAGGIMQRLTGAGVVGDFRPPDVLRFGLTPMYTGFAEIWRACEVLVGEVGKQGLLF